MFIILIIPFMEVMSIFLFSLPIIVKWRPEFFVMLFSAQGIGGVSCTAKPAYLQIWC